jgi:hypothetical protein
MERQINHAVLVSERWEDCIPQISGQTNGLTVYGAIKRFVYVVGPDEIEKRWMNVQLLNRQVTQR